MPEMLTRPVMIKMTESMYEEIEAAREEDDFAATSEEIRHLISRGLLLRKAKLDMKIAISDDIAKKIACLEDHVIALRAEIEESKNKGGII
ncbi:MAG: hypothetical protein WC145_13135 [Aliarcobacter sp.]|jgi:Arc/MetJ-type ribon-helix-helix transcriptional regulator